MKNGTLLCIVCVACGIFVGVYMTDFYQINKTSLCIEHSDFAMESVQKFISDDISKKYLVNIFDTEKTFELTESPSKLGNNLYSNIKHGVICESEFKANIKNIETNKQFITTINARYQLARAVYPKDSIYITMSSFDTEQAVDDLKDKIRSKESNKN